MVEATCEHCGDDFTYYPSNSSGRFCSYDCYKAYCDSDANENKVALTCAHCGDTFHKLPSNVSDAENHYCSQECQGRDRRADDPDGSIVCAECDDRFRTASALADHFERAHFDGRATEDSQCPTCGQDFEDRRGMRIHHQTVHGESLVPTVTKDCSQCDTEFTVTEEEAKHHDYRFCSPECFYDHGYGGKGVERVRRILTPDGTHWEEIAHRVREAADGQCEMCGEETPTHGRPGLQVHHLLPLRSGGTHAGWNLWALCPSCHGKAEAFALSTPGFGAVLLENERNRQLADGEEKAGRS